MIDKRIQEFKERIAVEPEFCAELFEYATLRLLASKYAYYILDNNFIKDVAYDLEEKDWYVMGRALGKLDEDETSPCLDFDYNHPMAEKAIELANKLVGGL